MDMNELQHHGIKGQKWGVRRYQNADGTLTSEGKKRYSEQGTLNTESQSASSSNQTKKIVKAAVVSALTVASVAAVSTYAAKNPEKVKNMISKVKDSKVSELSKQAVEKGKNTVKSGVKSAYEGAKEGVKEGVKDAPKKAAKTVVTGVVLNQTKRILDEVVGKEESARIFQANDNKKIGKFWKVSSEDEDKD